jgi:hypothetical protein
MATCNVVQTIDRTECIGNSLVKINSNFGALDSASCELTTYISNLQSTVASLSSSLQAAIGQIGSIGSVPVGAVSYFIGSAAPAGWLVADGSAILIATYSNLSDMLYVGNVLNPTAAFGYKCTSETNPTATRNTAGTFIKLPDLRGYFLRGLGTNADGSASVGYGSNQLDAFKSHGHTGATDVQGNHAHSYSDAYTNQDPGGGGGSGSSADGAGDRTRTTSVAGAHAHNVTVYAAGDIETRPKNVPLLPCIKY